MPKPRKQQISLSDTPYYHCVSRCVRRAFLCGDDKVTGKSYEHRRYWVEEYLVFLTQVFAVELCAYAVMSNHTHVVLHVNAEKAQSWSDREVIERWHQLHKGTMVTQQFIKQGFVAEYLQPLLDATVAEYRARLQDISWFMRELNESIARRANREDGCTGRFWEGRFKSQALLDEAALAACMAYVDLNPVRAGMAETPEVSDYTSIKQRVKAAKNGQQPSYLMPFVGNPKEHQPEGLTFALQDYLQLVDLTGRVLRAGKRGAIDLSCLPVLQRLNITSECWLKIANEFEQHTYTAVATEQVMADYCAKHARRKLKGIVAA
ncbi:hypothetical protein MAQ5080_00378 [Marinomonas aquimarina]|uniref:Transposase IS200-like domain-containing protein n=1 Tax=Marinomonas aquimarina TaxID=295068 RepID=A0A1A8T378_9GAMM|nr:transposase [Marinomonas aquimarina]SBS25824.1 hypothetical protein MAQ5080_00378 [Marinomonas aquimarina]